MTKEEWIQKCADQFVKTAELCIDNAIAAAEECSKNEEEYSESKDPDKWELPEDSALSEMSYWEA